MLKKQPLWVAVPDVVGDAEETLKLWSIWNKRVPFKLSFVAQDGHEPQDVPKEAHAVFIGGSTEWKLSNAHKFKGITDWLHIGRVNTMNRLNWAEHCGADSVDGTGFFRSKQQRQDLINFIEGEKQHDFSF